MASMVTDDQNCEENIDKFIVGTQKARKGKQSMILLLRD